MTLTQLEYVLAVSKHQHFGRAAKSCNVTQPTLSTQIHKLEEELNVTIFDRSQSPIELTAMGKVIVEKAKKIFQEHDSLLDVIKMDTENLIGNLKISVIPTLSPYIVPLFINIFKEKYPGIKLEITENQTHEIIDLLHQDKIDIGLLVTPINEKNLVEIPLYYEAFWLFIHPQHEYFKLSEINQENLNTDKLWLLNKGHCFRDQVLKVCQSREQEEGKDTINFESGSFETLRNLVLKGDSYTILPQMCVDELPEKYREYCRPFSLPTPTREVSIIHKKDTLKSKFISVLEEEILAEIPDTIRETTVNRSIIPIS